MIQLIKGSIFDAKCDLIIIPCNNMGGITSSIQNEIMINGLPYFNRQIPLGDIQFIENTGNIANASVVGYAASVDANGHTASSKELLENIMKKIKICCQEQDLHKVNIPLLGTGAGGLSAKTSYDVIKSEFENDRSISICIYVLSENVYQQIIDERVQVKNDIIKNPRVFISYTATDIENRNWVKNFACKLRKNGVNARIDIFHLKPGQDLPQWMTNELIMADKVLLICDKYYAEKADSRKGGVGWETMIIQGDLMSKQEHNKYIAILRDKDIDQGLPIYVKSRYALNWADENQMEKNFNEFLLCLFDCDIEPPIGEIPSFVKEKLTKNM